MACAGSSALSTMWFSLLMCVDAVLDVRLILFWIKHIGKKPRLLNFIGSFISFVVIKQFHVALDVICLS